MDNKEGWQLNKSIPLVFLFLMFLISSCLATEEKQLLSPVQPTMNPSQDILDYFPLNKNAYWVYQGTVKWTRVNSSDTVEEEITWKLE